MGTITRKLKDFPAKEAKIWKGGQKPLEKIVLKKGLSGQDVFSFLSAEVYFDMMNLPLPQDINGILDRFLSENLITKDEIGYGITKLGAILFAKRLSNFDGLKRKMVRVIVYKGKGKVETIREQSFDKGYAICFEEMVAWINSQLPANEEIGMALRKDARMYPEIAIRELAANMIIHQDFSEQGFPMIEIYSDRITLSNPGAVEAQAKLGEMTLCRFDGDNGEYSLLLGNAKGVDGPYTKGTYVWVEVENWKRLEAKIVEGPYIHHCVGIHKDIVPVLYEACKYIGVKPDLYDDNEEEVKAYIRGE